MYKIKAIQYNERANLHSVFTRHILSTKSDARSVNVCYHFNNDNKIRRSIPNSGFIHCIAQHMLRLFSTGLFMAVEQN